MMEAHVPRNPSGYLQDYNGITTKYSHPHDFRQNYDKCYIMYAGLCTRVNKLAADLPFNKKTRNTVHKIWGSCELQIKSCFLVSFS
jgi:hypothetical protein